MPFGWCLGLFPYLFSNTEFNIYLILVVLPDSSLRDSKAKVKFVEDDEEEIVTLVTTMDLDPENMMMTLLNLQGS